MKDGLASEKLGNWGNHLLLKTRREASSGRAELHEKQSELIIVQSGHVTIIIGGKILNGQITAPCGQRIKRLGSKNLSKPPSRSRQPTAPHFGGTSGKGREEKKIALTLMIAFQMMMFDVLVQCPA